VQRFTPMIHFLLLATLLYAVQATLPAAEEIILTDFESGSYQDWKVEGTAFGKKPADEQFAAKSGVNGFSGKGVALSCPNRDAKPTGILTSPEFTIERDYINLRIGGGPNKKGTGVKVMVEGEEVAAVSGERSSFLDETSIPVKEFRGKKAAVVVYDQDPGWWGFVAVDDIRQSDQRVGFDRVEKKIPVTGKLLLFPVAKPGADRNLEVTDEKGARVHTLLATLAQKKEDIMWWGYLEVDDYIGKTLTISLNQKVGSSLLDMIECADEPRMLQPKYSEALRPQFHFSQLTGWNNDPNGMFWADGYYHLFWQCNPLGTAWGNMYWGHARSPDLIHWTEMKRAVRSGPGKGKLENPLHPSMAFGACFSGGGNVDVHNTAGWKTGDKDVQFLLVSDMSRGQSIAYSTDGGENFKFYDKNPVFILDGNDAKPIWYAPGKHWVAAVFDKKKEIGNNIAIWTSPNLKDWKHESNVPGFYECPEIFELPVDGNPNNKKWVLAGATMDYLVGSFDGKKFIPDPQEKQTLLTKVNVYAGQCFSNAPDGRVIFMAWAKVSMGNSPFNNGFTIPMEFTLRTVASGRVNLFTNPVKEIETLREAPEVEAKNIELTSTNDSFSKALTGQLYDVCITLQKMGNPKEAVISIGGTSVTYNFESETCAGKPAPMTGGKVNLRILLDRPTAEVFCADGFSYELLKRPDGGKNVEKIAIRAIGPPDSKVIVDSLTVYPMKSIWQPRTK